MGKRRLILPMPVPLIRLVAGDGRDSCGSRSRSPPTSSASCGSTTSGRSTSSRRGSGSSRGRWRAPSATSRTAKRTASVSVAGGPRPAGVTPGRPARIDPSRVRVGSAASRRAWARRSIVARSSLGAAGLVAGDATRPGSAGRAGADLRGRRRGRGRSSMRPRRTSRTLADRVDALGAQARGALPRWSTARPTRSTAAIAQGDELWPTIAARTTAIRARPRRGPVRRRRRRPTSTSRRRCGSGTRGSSRRSSATDGLEARLGQLTVGAAAAGRLAAQLAEHDRLVGRRGRAGPGREVQDGDQDARPGRGRDHGQPGASATGSPDRRRDRARPVARPQRDLRRGAARRCTRRSHRSAARSPRRSATAIAAEKAARQRLPRTPAGWS